MPTNRLSIRNVRSVPRTIPAVGANLSVQFEARASVAPATASAQYRVAPGFPYRVTSGANGAPAIITSERTVSQSVGVAHSSSTAVSFIQIDVVASIPGDVTQTRSCFVWIANPIGVHLRSFRQANGLTQSSLAQRLGISVTTISRVEGGHFPSASIEELIAEEIANA